MSHRDLIPPIPSRPPMQVNKESKLTTNLSVLLAVVGAVWVASSQWSLLKHDSVDLSKQVADHTAQLTSLQTIVSSLNDQVRTVQANQNAQTEILRYLARDRKGPVPEAAK